VALASSLFGGAKAPLTLLISLALPRTDGNEKKIFVGASGVNSLSIKINKKVYYKFMVLNRKLD
jgi:hypothetical protein